MAGTRNFGRDPFNQNFPKTQWIGSVQLQPEKFQKNGSTFWGGPIFPVGPVGILVECIAPFNYEISHDLRVSLKASCRSSQVRMHDSFITTIKKIAYFLSSACLFVCYWNSSRTTIHTWSYQIKKFHSIPFKLGMTYFHRRTTNCDSALLGRHDVFKIKEDLNIWNLQPVNNLDKSVFQ